MSEHVQAGIAKEADGGIKSVLSSALERLSPGYFALVMATGIVSVGLYLVGFVQLSTVLLWITAAACVVLWGLYIWRAVRHRQAMRRDLRGAAVALLFVRVVVGFGLGAVRAWQVSMRRDGRPRLSRPTGSWLVWAVASEAVAPGLANAQGVRAGDGRRDGILFVVSFAGGVAL